MPLSPRNRKRNISEYPQIGCYGSQINFTTTIQNKFIVYYLLSRIIYYYFNAQVPKQHQIHYCRLT